MIDFAGLAIAVLAILFGGLLKGAVGMGSPLIAVPVLAAVYDVRTAIAVMTLPSIVSNIWQMWTNRHAGEGRKALLRLLAGCVIGVVIGTFLLGIVPNAWLTVVLAMLLIAYLALNQARPDFALAPPKAQRTAVSFGLVTGILHGTTGVSAVVVTFLHAQHLARAAHLFAVSSAFLVLSISQIGALSAVGMMGWQLAAASLAAVAPIMAGAWLGQHLSSHFSQHAFERLTLAVLAFVAVGLLAKAVPEILA